MVISKQLYGKVFISHASVDKPFVRRLVKAIEADGFLAWLDEKELLAGDPLAQRVSEGVAQSRAVLVVVSQAAVKSKWLAFELNKAADRMVKGECIVIPIVKDDINKLPPEVEGLLYADFTKSFKRPMQAVLKSLNSDAQRRSFDHSFYARNEMMLEEVFDGKGFSFTDAEYKSKDENVVFVKNGTDEDLSVPYDILSDYGDTRPLTDLGVSDIELALEDSTDPIRLVVSERPIAATRLMQMEHPSVRVRVTGNERGPNGFIVFADMSSASGIEDFRLILVGAKKVLEKIAKSHGNRWGNARIDPAVRRPRPTLREALGIDTPSERGHE